jgi:hypothetical protein
MWTGGHNDYTATEGNLFGCKKSMTPSKPKPLLFTKGLQEVAYTCKSCGKITVEVIKADTSSA